MQSEDQKKPAEVTRDELHRLVWQAPMQTLAKQFGISGNGLAKICDRLNVPYPPRGYWAKVAAGKNVVTYRLPPAKADTPLTVVITPTPAREVRPEPTSEIALNTDNLRSEIEPLVVSEKLSRPHSIIQSWLDDHARRKQQARQERDPWRKKLYDPGEFSEADRRRHRVLDAFFKAIEKQKGKVQQGDRQALFVEINGEKIEFQVREKQKQTRRPLTSHEKSWSSASDKGWRRELQPTGRLTFVIKTYLPTGLRTEWVETDKTPMETLLPETVATFVAAGPLLVEQRRQREQAQRERQIAEAKRYEEARKKKLDDNRWRRFVEFAETHREISDALVFLNALKSADFDPAQQIAGYSIAGWIAWAEDRLVDNDPLNRGPAVVFDCVSRITEWTYRD